MDSTPAVVDGVVYIGNSWGEFFAIEPPSAEEIAAGQAEQAAEQPADQTWDTYLDEIDTALRTSPDLPAAFTVIDDGSLSAQVNIPLVLDGADYRLVVLGLPAVTDSLNAVIVARYGTADDAERAVATSTSSTGGLRQGGWFEAEVDGVEQDHACFALAGSSYAKAVCYVNRDEFVLVTLSFLPIPDVDAATTNATDLAVYANAVFDRVPRPAS